MSVFRRLSSTGATIRLIVDGRTVEARAGDTVASALLASGLAAWSSNAATGGPSAPLCLIGQCFGCVCTIDGRPGVQACLVRVRDDMTVETLPPKAEP